MSISDAIRNFQSFLRAALPFLQSAGVTAGTDEWDDFAELAFEILVARPVGSAASERITWKYGNWTGPAVAGGSVIMVTVAPGASILVGDPGADIATVNFKEVSGGPVIFAFREFSHPFVEVGSSVWLGHVFGEVVDQNQPYSIGANVCAPLKQCEFELFRPPDDRHNPAT